MNWDDIAYPFGTDKASRIPPDHPYAASRPHCYMKFYEEILSSRDIRSVLEIGVLNGGSLRLWAYLFPESKVIGLDIDPECLKHAGNRISVEMVDQSKEDQLAAFALRCPTLDLIIDDGSHVKRDIVLTLKTLWPKLNPNGVYAIEDLYCETPYNPEKWGGWEGDIRQWASENGGTMIARPSSGLPEHTAVYFIIKHPRQ